MRLGKIMIFVSDLAEAKRFYQDILGFPLKAESADRLDFIHEGCDFIAFKCERNATVEDYSRVARSVFVFEVASIDEALRDLRARGVSFLHHEPAENEFSRYAAFLDPFGNVHEIYEPKR
ncbi:MAG TPA: VOC family protein [Pyrinomonadaceae bacterium]